MNKVVFLFAKNSSPSSSRPEKTPSEESPLVELVQVPGDDAAGRLRRAINMLLNAGKPSSVDTDAKDGGEESGR